MLVDHQPRRGLKWKMAIVSLPSLLLLTLLVGFFPGGCLSRFDSNQTGVNAREPGVSAAFPEDIKVVVLDAARTKGGRGDTAPAYLAARELRFRGYSGDVLLNVSDAQGDRILSLLSTDYLLKSTQSPGSARLTIEDGIEVLRSYIDAEAAKLPARPDLAFGFALRPSEISQPSDILGARYSVFLGVFNLRQIATSNNQKNRLVAEGRSYELPDAGLGPRDLGHYSNSFVSHTGRLTSRQRKEALLASLGHDSEIYQKLLSSRPELNKLIKRNERLKEFFQQQLAGSVDQEGKAGSTQKETIESAVGYGLGLSTVWPQFFDYLNAAQNVLLDQDCQPRQEARSLVMFYPTVFEAETQVQFMKNVQKTIRCPQSFELVDLTADEFSWQSKAGGFQLVMTGNLPHESFTYLLASSDYPSIVSGDNSVADAINLGIPFVMTTVEWNAFSQKGVGAFINHVAQSLSIQPEFVLSLGRLFDSKTPGYLLRSFLYEKHPDQTKLLFDEVKSRSSAGALLDSVMKIIAQVKEQPESNNFFEVFENPLYVPRSRWSELLNPKTALSFEPVVVSEKITSERASGHVDSPYQSDEALLDLEVKVLPEKLFNRQGIQLNGYYQFILTLDGQIFASKERVPHHILADRAPVAAAGEVSVQSGKVNYCNGFSKSYTGQSKSHLAQFPARLKELGHQVPFSTCEKK